MLKPGQLVVEPQQRMLVISVSNGLKSGAELGNKKSSQEFQFSNFANKVKDKLRQTDLSRTRAQFFLVVQFRILIFAQRQRKRCNGQK